MPRYFFQVRDGVSEADTEGTEKPNIEAARRAAALLAGSLLRDYPDDVLRAEDWRIEVTDDRGLLLFRIDVQLTDSPASSLDPIVRR